MFGVFELFPLQTVSMKEKPETGNERERSLCWAWWLLSANRVRGRGPPDPLGAPDPTFSLRGGLGGADGDMAWGGRPAGGEEARQGWRDHRGRLAGRQEPKMAHELFDSGAPLSL